VSSRPTVFCHGGEWSQDNTFSSANTTKPRYQTNKIKHFTTRSKTNFSNAL